ncbi:hypothetical protein GIB67_018788 [Kingdonia uniflora]|uniref:Uncharacterized protein n=1 Tax=Kingdonia uniflora TaxID=39325 RepID=A0A7J7NE58_9MAGN|nr:hypothetical protein GIB67_018788 [Kingdonia uniflora]
MRGKKLSEVMAIFQEIELLGYLTNAEMTKACLKFSEHLEYADMFVGLATLDLMLMICDSSFMEDLTLEDLAEDMVLLNIDRQEESIASGSGAPQSM